MAFIEGWPHLRSGLYEGFHCIIIVQKFGLSQVSGSQLTLSDVETSSDQDNNVTLVLREGTNNSLLFGEKLSCSHSVAVPGWMRTRRRGGVQDKAEFTPVADHEATLTQMLLSHQTSDFCLVGGKVLMQVLLCVCMYVCMYVCVSWRVISPHV